jgi:hypothetical protein
VKVNYLTLLAAVAVILSAAATRADDNSSAFSLWADTTAASPGTSSTAAPVGVAPVGAATGRYGETVAYNDDCDPVADFIARVGAWGVHQSGSPIKVDEYQSPNSSPFWNADGIWSNGDRTVDYSLTGSDNDTSDARVHYFGQNVEADIDYERFDHQLDSHVYNGFNFRGNNTVTKGTSAANAIVYSDDNRAPGQDFAIRVQEFKANFKGNITDNLKWRVNVFGMDKEGDRQANSFTHCSAGALNGSTVPPGGTGATNASPLNSQCHVVNQSQHIDWQTTEVTPALELRMGCDTYLEYSHTIRAFTADDQAVTYNYHTNVSSVSLNPAANIPANSLTTLAGLGIVPDSQTQMDHLKFSTKIGAATDVYLLGYDGYNEDLLRSTYRDFNGADLRITNRSLDTLTVTGFGKYYREESTSPLYPLSPTPTPANDFYQEPGLGSFPLGAQINREIHTFGVNCRWRPYEGETCTYRGNMSIVGGYEYSTLLRENAGDTLLAGGPNTFVDPTGLFLQPNSNKNTFFVGVEEKWSKALSSYIRYKYIHTEYPLYGITPDQGTSNRTELDSSLPTQENRVEIGSTWTPADNLMINATLYVENAMSNAPYVNWTSNSVPFTLSAWYAPSTVWSFNAGAAVMDGYINQDVNLGNLNAVPGTAIPGLPWKFTSAADVFDLGARFAATEKLSFNGELEYVHGLNGSSAFVNPLTQIGNPLPAGSPTTPYQIGTYSNVLMQSFRFGLGADYLVRPNITTYARYNYYNYGDDTGTTSGQVNMFLLGASAKY